MPPEIVYAKNTFSHHVAGLVVDVQGVHARSAVGGRNNLLVVVFNYSVELREVRLAGGAFGGGNACIKVSFALIDPVGSQGGSSNSEAADGDQCECSTHK